MSRSARDEHAAAVAEAWERLPSRLRGDMLINQDMHDLASAAAWLAAHESVRHNRLRAIARRLPGGRR